MPSQSRRQFLRNALGLSAGLIGASALNPLYAEELAEFKGPAVPDVEAVQASKRVYYVPAMGPHPTPDNYAFFSNPNFIVTEKGVVVVDTGSSVQIGEMILRQIKKVTDKPVIKVINTHEHGDHWLGNHAFVQAYPDVEIYAHPNCRKRLKSGQDEFWFNFMQTNSDNKITGTVMTLPDQELTGGEVWELGDTTLKIHYFGKVHTASDLTVEVVEDKTMVMGDTVMRRIANMADGSFQGTIDALKQVKAMNLETFVPMHGAHDDIGLIEDGLNFMELLYMRVGELYDEGLSDYEMKPIIMDEPFMKDVASQWPGYEDTLGTFISVAMQEYEMSLF
ncbi:MBL fold metallo-hydrolase [Thiomicrospira sp. WB1]|uniref:MBL fold metallo-hydrolase n=1 Tax=Thiomicrospira sp. WB1 TaxID=1685380 RepID=UPI000748F007|nr:MBL fold metallo-hydrolase [Thiomicrospira sp. WB1]KUJ71559.1 MBL fold metallo-hydrolase [Thiomicrospira sp. WB1]